MRQSWKVYVVAVTVSVVSFLLAWTLPTTEILRGIVGLPGAVALLTVLYQIVRDQAAHERALALQEKQQLFNLGVTSHMAQVAFDKHVQFSEQYIARMQRGLGDLSQTGPREESLKFLNDLVDIRLSFRAWITEDLEIKLMPFEKALRQIGGLSIELEGLPHGEARTLKLHERDKVWLRVLGLNDKDQIDERIAPRKIMSHLQELLGVTQLSRLREATLQAAIDALKRNA